MLGGGETGKRERGKGGNPSYEVASYYHFRNEKGESST